MFDDFLKQYPPMYAIKPSKKRAKKDISAVLSLIKKNECPMTKHKRRLKPLIITAVIIIFTLISLFTVNAATEGGVVKFFMGGREIEGDYDDYVDHEGFRHITFSAVLPIDADNFAVIYDVDKPWGENVRVITEEADPEFIGKIRQYRDAEDKFFEDMKVWYKENNITKEDMEDPDSEFNKTFNSAEAVGRPCPEPEDFGLIFKNSEICSYRFVNCTNRLGGFLGGNFMRMGNAVGKPAKVGGGGEIKYDLENATKTFKETICYYVG